MHFRCVFENANFPEQHIFRAMHTPQATKCSPLLLVSLPLMSRSEPESIRTIKLMHSRNYCTDAPSLHSAGGQRYRPSEIRPLELRLRSNECTKKMAMKVLPEFCMKDSGITSSNTACRVCRRLHDDRRQLDRPGRRSLSSLR
jgi:hypothetical protein